MIPKGVTKKVETSVEHDLKAIVHLNKMHAPTSHTTSHFFNEHSVLHHLKHYLPSQTPLKDFIHHNSMHAFQHLKFYDAIFKASGIFGYQVTLELKDFRKMYREGRISEAVLENVIIAEKGKAAKEGWKNKLVFESYDECKVPRVGVLRTEFMMSCKVDLDTLVQPLLFRILCSYLDQGISLWKFPDAGDGFLNSIRVLEANSSVSFFKTTRAKKLLLEQHCEIKDLLRIIVGEEKHFEQYLYDQQFAHRGWSGMVAAIESDPKVLLDTRKITLHDMIMLELLLEIDTLDYYIGAAEQHGINRIKTKPSDIFAPVAHQEIQDVFKLWQQAFEWTYYDEVLKGIVSAGADKKETISGKSFQALFCIDERECSLRRHLEHADPLGETFGTPGFFGVEFYFQPMHAKFYDKLCPAPVTPKYLIKETEGTLYRAHELLYNSILNKALPGVFLTPLMGYFAGFKIFRNLFRPKMSPAISNAFIHMDKSALLTIENKSVGDRENNLQIGFTVEEMAQRVEGLLRSIGLTSGFSSLIYLVAHGSSSANNPHHGAHDCGACSGRPGSVNARVMAGMANHVGVRTILKSKGIDIPETTQFLGALHDTAADQVEFYDEQLLQSDNKFKHHNNIKTFETALNYNAKERSRRFASIKTKQPIEAIRKAIHDRSVSLFEPRPELGHGTNSLCIVGRRELTKRVFLDRRAFLNSYDYRSDPDGSLLVGVMKPLGPVCGGINLEYYFSRVDNHKLGAGTKLPHNVVGLFGVANSYDGDLRPGLPLQMIEVHDPVRLLIIVEHFPEIVLKTIQSVPEMYEWFINEWVHLVAVEPETNTIHYFRNGAFTPYKPISQEPKVVTDQEVLIERAIEMESNYIADATKENLPVYLIG